MFMHACSLKVFLRSYAVATVFSAVRFGVATIRGRLLFEAGVYFFGKPTEINDCWIRYVRAIQ